MISSKTLLVLLAVIATCYGDGLDKKHHHHHYGMHHHQFFYYLTFLLIKLKIVFFLGTIFTISLVAGKVIAIIKFSEYMKNKHHHEEKIVYINPHEHEHHDSGGYPGGYASASEIQYKTPSSYPPDFSVDHPPADAYINHNERYSHTRGTAHYTTAKSSGRSIEDGGGSYGSRIYRQLTKVADRLRQSNITDMALNEMGIKDEHCKKKFVCKAEYNAKHSMILDAGFNILKDVSYQKYKPNSTITSEEECESLYDGCKEL